MEDIGAVQRTTVHLSPRPPGDDALPRLGSGERPPEVIGVSRVRLRLSNPRPALLLSVVRRCADSNGNLAGTAQQRGYTVSIAPL